MVITSNCNNMGNTKKVVIHISKFRAGKYLFLFYMRYRKFFKYKRIWLCQKKPQNAKKMHVGFLLILATLLQYLAIYTYI